MICVIFDDDDDDDNPDDYLICDHIESVGMYKYVLLIFGLICMNMQQMEFSLNSCVIITRLV